MRNPSRAIFAVLLAGLLCLLAACTSVKKTDEQMNRLLETAFNTIQAGDFDTVVDIFVISSEEHAAQLRASLPEIQAYIDSPLRYYNLLARSTERQKIAGEPCKFTQYIYRVRALAHEYIVSLTYGESPTQQGIYDFRVVRTEDAGPLPTHPELTRYISPVLTALCYGVALFALVHCLRGRARRKILLCLMILVQARISSALRYSGPISHSSVNGSFWVHITPLGSSHLQLYTNGFEIALMVPLGAVIYLILRNRWKEKPRKTFFVKNPSPDEIEAAESAMYPPPDENETAKSEREK